MQAVRSEAIVAGEPPDPKLLLGVQSLPIEGPERWSLNDDGMTMRMIGLMQEMPNRESVGHAPKSPMPPSPAPRPHARSRR